MGERLWLSWKLIGKGVVSGTWFSVSSCVTCWHVTYTFKDTVVSHWNLDLEICVALNFPVAYRSRNYTEVTFVPW